MATEERSIEISAKLDVKDLIRNLESIPGITSKEAKKMAKAFDTQLKQTEKAAKKSAEASKKAAKATAAAARRGSKDFDRLSDSAQRAEKQLEEVADNAGEIDRGFSSVGLALREVNPQLAEAADGLADTFAVAEGLVLTFKSLNPAMLAGAAALGTLTLGYFAYQDSIEKARQLTLDMRDAQKSLSDAQKEHRQNMMDAARTINDLRDELDLATGVMTEYEAQLRQAQRAASDGIQDNIDYQKQLLIEKKKEIAMVKDLRAAAIDNRKQAVVLSEEQTNQLRNLQLLTEGAKNNLDLTRRGKQENESLTAIYNQLLSEVGAIEYGLEGLNKMQEEAVNIAGQIVEYKKEQADEDQRIADQQEAAQKAAQKAAEQEAERLRLQQEKIKAEQEAARLKEAQIQLSEKTVQGLDLELLSIQHKYDTEIDRIRELGKITGDLAGQKAAIEIAEMQREKELNSARNKNIEQTINAERELFKLTAEGIELEIIKIDEKYQKEFERIKELAELTGDNAEAQKAIDVAKKNRDKEISDARKKQIDEEMKKELERIHKTVGATGDLYASMSDLAGAFANENYKYADQAFYIQKALSLSSVTMKTAEAIMTAAASAPFPANAIPIASAAATGAAQLAAVTQQQPSFHMGGLAPDEANARVLRGEAVLDRATVRRIGGEQGVQKLQEGKQDNETVVIIQPFKHFGRFAREIGFKKPKQTGIARY